MATSLPPRLPAGERLRRAGIAAWSIIGILIVVAISIWALLKIRVIFPPLVLALLIIYLVNPIVVRFERRGLRRGVAVLVSYVLVLSALVMFIIVVSRPISSQVAEFGDQLPQFRRELVSFVNGAAETIRDRTGIDIDTATIECVVGPGESIDGERRCTEVTQRFRQELAQHAGRITELGLGVLEALLVFVLAPLIALYLLMDLPHLQRDLLNLVPETHREEMRDLASKMGRAVGGFFRGQLLVAVLVGVLSALGFFIIGLPFWGLIGAIAGFFNLVPLVGPFIGGGIGFIVGTMSGGIQLGLLAVLVEAVVQQLDNHLISPKVMSRTVKLHPATVILSLLAGGTLAGFWGVLLAVPAVAVIKLVLNHLWTTRVLGAEASPFAGTRPETG